MAKKMKIKEIKSKIKIIDTPKERDHSELEEDVADEPMSTMSVSSQSATPLIRESRPLPQRGVPREDVEPKARRPSENSERAQAEAYTAMATNDNVTRYTMHTRARPDTRLGTRSSMQDSSPTITPIQRAADPLRQASPLEPVSTLQRDAGLSGDRGYRLYKEGQGIGPRATRRRR